MQTLVQNCTRVAPTLRPRASEILRDMETNAGGRPERWTHAKENELH